MSNPSDRPRLESPYFGGEAAMYARMARVLRYTAHRYCPEWTINVQAIAPEQITGPQRRARYLTNSQKLAAWCRTVREAPMGARILLIDADTFITNPIDDIWDRHFDLAYTVRTYELPFNTGVMFVRVTPETKAFFELWRQQNHRMYCDRTLHQAWKEKYGGITQASFGYLLEREDHGLDLLTLPCAEWNCEDSTWSRFGPATRIVHVKSALRRFVFEGTASESELDERVTDERELIPLAERWHELEREATRTEAA